MSNDTKEGMGGALSPYQHMDPEKHLIGEALATPSAVSATGVASVGVSPIAAREDHDHGNGSIGLASGFQLVTLGGNFNSYGSPYPRLQVIKIGTMVHLEGFIKCVANPSAANSVLGTLPAGHISTNGTYGRNIRAGIVYQGLTNFSFYIETDGTLHHIDAIGLNTLLAFDNTWFTNQI